MDIEPEAKSIWGNEQSTVNTLKPQQNDHHFADNISKCIFLNENYCILIKISLRFVPYSPIENNEYWFRKCLGPKPPPSHLCITWSRGINSLAPVKFQFNLRQVIFKLTLVNGGWGISYEIALRWMPLDLTDDKSTLVQVMAWCRYTYVWHTLMVIYH